MVEAHPRWSRLLLAASGLLGATGVALGAVSAHVGGGGFAQLASLFLLLHAAAVPGILATTIGSSTGRLLAASLLAMGAALFSGDLAVLGLTGHTPLAGMAPVGGLLLIGGWLVLAAAAFVLQAPEGR